MAHFYARWLPRSTPLTRHIVREILKSENRPLHNHEIWHRCQEYKLTPKEAALHKQDLQKYAPEYRVDPAKRVVPPNADHPIRSLRYLKAYVLHDLEERGEIVRQCIKREPTPAEMAQIATQTAVSRKKRRRIALDAGKQPPILINGMAQEFKWRLADSEELERKMKVFEEKQRLVSLAETRLSERVQFATDLEKKRKAASQLEQFQQSVKKGTWKGFKGITVPNTRHSK